MRVSICRDKDLILADNRVSSLTLRMAIKRMRTRYLKHPRHVVMVHCNQLHGRIFLLPRSSAQQKLHHYHHTMLEFDVPTIIVSRYTNLVYYLTIDYKYLPNWLDKT